MSSLLDRSCEAINSDSVAAQNAFWEGQWDAHTLGWLISGIMAALTVSISLVTIAMHAFHYYRPQEQRQIIRILLMPPVYGLVSFFSYRFFRSYTYYEVAVVAYESLVVAAFLYLLLQYIGNSEDVRKEVLMDKEKHKIPFPFCCIRYRPSKPYFLHALRFSVLQYSFLRPLISIAAIVCQAYDVLCPTGYSVYFASVYLDAIDFVSISVALYGLIVFYALVKDQLRGKKPLAKFLCIKGIIFFVFYQGFVFDVLESHGVIKATEFWTAQNVADGLNALCTSVEMVIFASLMMWAFTWREYTRYKSENGGNLTNPLLGLWQSINYWDFVQDLAAGIVFAFDFCRGRPGTHAQDRASRGGFDINAAFNDRTPGPKQETIERERPSSGRSNSYSYAQNISQSVSLRDQLPPSTMQVRQSRLSPAFMPEDA